MKKYPVNVPVMIQVLPIEGGDRWIDLDSIVKIAEWPREAWWCMVIGVSDERFAQLMKDEHGNRQSNLIITTCDIHLDNGVVITVAGALEHVMEEVDREARKRGPQSPLAKLRIAVAPRLFDSCYDCLTCAR
jgi:hypothetical protein